MKISDPETVSLLHTLLTYRHSAEFNKLGMSALSAIVTSTLDSSSFYSDIAPLFLSKLDEEESLLETLFKKYINSKSD